MGVCEDWIRVGIGIGVLDGGGFEVFLFSFNAMFVVFIRCASLSKYRCYHIYKH